MAQAKAGDTVQVHYTGRFPEGDVFDSSRDRDPLEFQLGQGQVIAGVDNAVAGMAPGDQKTVTVPPEEGYGPRRDELVFTVERDRFPAQASPEIGQRYRVQQGERTSLVTVTAIGDDGVTLDANHPLAGKALTFELELVAIL